MFPYQKVAASGLEWEVLPGRKRASGQKSHPIWKSSLLLWALAFAVLAVVFLLSEVTLWALQAPPGLYPGNGTLKQAGVRLSGQASEQGPLDRCSSVPREQRFDCYPERNVVVTRELCEGRGCCFVGGVRPAPGSGGGVPWCFYPPDFPSYALENVKQTSLGLLGVLRRKVKAYYARDIERLQLNVNLETNTRLHIKLTDATSPRYEVPLDVPPATKKAQNPLYSVELAKEPFGVVVRRNSSGAVLLNTTVAPLIFADQFLQISTALPSKLLYGLGEHRSSFLHSLDWKTLTFWARDVPPMEDVNLYGTHPFYLMLEEGGAAHGVFLLNSNAMEVALQPAPALTWRTIGGILDFYIFLGPDPAAVIQQYQEVIGFPTMPPLWGLGFHLCRWGYGTSDETWRVVKDMRSEQIPQNAQWNDIDYMVGYRDFTFDPERFGTLPQMVEDLHGHGQHYVPIVDPGISSTQPPGSYWPYDEGLKRGIFVNTSRGAPLVGEVWPGRTAYPDFSDPEAQQWWFENLNHFYSRVPFDGLWIDMNEPSNFLDGSLDGCSSGDFDNPPYVPVLGGSLFSKTLCASAKHKASVHYNVHNLYGLMEAKATASALIKLRGKRPFVISRSTFPSQGRYSGHWLGDNRSQWKDMYWSISGLLNFNLFGVPLIGADICGFSGTTSEELCTRWMQLGAFYPFARNHNTEKEKAQDPTVFSPKIRAAMKEVLLTRYSLLPFLYTLFHRAHVSGATVLRPLFFEFPEDVTTYSIDRQFLWGGSLLVTPVLEAGMDCVTGYFPQGVWYDYYTGSALPSSGENLTLAAPLDRINVHIRAGAVIPTQKPDTTSRLSSGNPLRLTAALSQHGTAWGDLFWDDGDSLDTFEREDYSYLLFSVSENTFLSHVVHSNVEATSITVETLNVTGVKNKPSKVTANGKELPFSYLENQVLVVENLHLNLSVDFSISWM
ncbi:lysosomal alpha-glucosidase-like isoform X2 [Rhinatrema bivittatum]|uniref:lysosomal alpha-glucosidase-like isoform X2 n=1 Tax=Rhinatrema bivittatum TaxID=194408 RepID=UPI001127BBC4|nr:lysosomal alpha-glucosidase-like isoform X2 [Rhinatrema bivittatum]